MHQLRDAAFVALLIAGAAAWVAFPDRLVIEAPSFGGPEILTPGMDFEVEVRVAVPWITAIDELALVREGLRVPVQLVTTAGRGARWKLLGRIPMDCAPGLYDIVVRAGDREARAYHSVAVLTSIPSRFTVAQITDLHFGYAPSGDASVERIVDELNRLKPDLVVVTGDISHNGTRVQYESAQRALGKLTMPLVCVPGNHDYAARGAYLTWFGFPHRPVLFGRWTFLRLDTGRHSDQFTEGQFALIKRELNAAEPGRVIVLAHHPLAGRESVQAHAQDAIALFAKKKVPLVLSGHWHYGARYGAAAGTPAGVHPATLFVVTATAGGQPVRAPNGRMDPRGFTLVTVEDGQIASIEFRAVDSDAAEAGQ